MTLESLYPISGNNAIQNAAFALEWQGELSSREIIEIASAVADSLKSDLPIDAPQTVQKFTFINQLENQRYLPSTEIGGHVFERRSSHTNATSRSVNLTSNSLVVSINEYSRWENVWKDVKRYFESFLPHISKPIHNIGLQYVDMFLWRDDPRALDLSQVFRKDTKFIAANSLEVKELWHSHHGYIARFETPVPNNRLDNINVGLIDDNGTRALQIVTSHRATPEVQIWIKQDNIEVVKEHVASFFNEMHNENKKIMRELLSDEVCNKIKLIS